jgi:Ulp1 family protease
LEANRWLNDEIVNATLYQTHQQYAGGKFILFNTFFYCSLMRKGIYKYGEVEQWMSKACGAANINPFSSEHIEAIFFPIHSQNHYFVVVADIAKRELTYYDTLH